MNEENTAMKDVIEEIKTADEDSLKKLIEDWFESTRTQGMKIGAKYISAAVASIINKHLRKADKASLRDYKRCVDDIIKVISVQLTEQNDSVEENNDEQDSDI